MRAMRMLALVATTAAAAAAAAAAGAPHSDPYLAAQGWKLIWSDEFDGTALNTSNWEVMTGNGEEYGVVGWGNDEQQFYGEEALRVARGHLAITITPRQNHTYSSGRIRSLGRVEHTYGRIEGRFKLPRGTGLWPGFWMLPSKSVYGDQWAASGEIDIMEAVDEMDHVFGTLHFGGAWPDNKDSGTWPPLSALACAGGAYCRARLPGGASFAGEYRVFALEWEANEMRWYADDRLACRRHRWYGGGGAAPFPAPFDVPFHLLINVAVGGGLAGWPATRALPQEMLVDYVRWYQRDGPPAAPMCGYYNLRGALLPRPARALLLLAVPALAAAVLAATGFDGLPILAGGWTVCEAMEGAHGGGCGAPAAAAQAPAAAVREALLLAAALALPLGLLQAWRLHARATAAAGDAAAAAPAPSPQHAHGGGGGSACGGTPRGAAMLLAYGGASLTGLLLGATQRLRNPRPPREGLTWALPLAAAAALCAAAAWQRRQRRAAAAAATPRQRSGVAAVLLRARSSSALIRLLGAAPADPRRERALLWAAAAAAALGGYVQGWAAAGAAAAALYAAWGQAAGGRWRAMGALGAAAAAAVS